MARAIKEITADHRKVAALRAQGLAHREIAAKTGFSIGHVKTILLTPEIRDLVAVETIRDSNLQTDKSVKEVIDRASLKAIQLLEQVIVDSDLLGDNAPTTKQRIDAAIEMLGIAGYGKSQKVDHTHSHILQPADLIEIRQRARLLPAAEVIDVEAS